MFDQFRNKFPLDDDKWNDYISCFKRMKVSARTALLKEGDIPKKMFLVEKGCIRVWFNNDGKDVTFQFFFENNMVASIESFRKERPSPVTIETIEVSWPKKSKAPGFDNKCYCPPAYCRVALHYKNYQK